MALAILPLAVAPVGAEVLRDGSIGPGVGIQPTGPDYRVDEGMGALRGGNLFHSFSRFDIGTGESALFSAVSPVVNVIARVTGGSASRIDGRVSSDIPGASLYVLNPSGVLLGPDARIDVDGDLALGSADYLRFSDDARLDARPGGGTLLSSAPPAAFGFLGPDAAAVRVDRGRIAMRPGRSLLLAGGDLALAADTGAPLLTAESGHIALFGVASPGEVVFGAEPRAVGFTRLGNISLTTLEPDAGGADGADSSTADDRGGLPGAQIDVSGDPTGRVLILGGDLSARDFVIAADTTGDLDPTAGGIEVLVRGGVAISGASQFASSSEATGRGGAVTLTAREILLTDESELLSDALAQGAGGRVSLVADQVTLDGDAEIATDAEGSGAGGSVSIRAGTLRLLGNSEISSDTDPASTAIGGNVRVTASGSVSIQIDGEEPAGIFTNSEGAGRAGDIDIDAPSLSMRGGVITAETSAGGAGGHVNIRATAIDLQRGAAISALSSGEFDGAGDAGNVSVSGVGSMTLGGGSAVTTQSGFSDGGNIAIVGDGLLLVRDGRLSANVSDGVGGNLDVRTDTVALHRSAVVAQAGAGQGGNISIAARRFLSSESLISASSETGISGTVSIDAPNVDLSGSLAALQGEFLDAASLLRVACAARRQSASSSFVVATRRGLPAGSDGLPLERGGIALEGYGDLQDPAILPGLALSERARDALAIGDEDQARRRLALAEDRLSGAAPGVARVHAWIHWTDSLLRLAASQPADRDRLLLRAYRRLESAREDAESIGSARALSYVLGNQALLYRSERRVEEALYLARRAQLAAERADAPESLYRWHWLRGQLLWATGRTGDAIRAYRAAVDILGQTRQEAFIRADSQADFFSRSIAPVYLDLVDALLKAGERVDAADIRDRLWREARSTIEGFRAAELRDYFSDPCVAEQQARSTGLDALAEDAAIVYPILLPDRLELLVTLPGGIRRYAVDVGSARLTWEAEGFRQALQSEFHDYRELARRLYDWLVRPYADALIAAGVRTLVFVPDGPLRAIPFAALLDGDAFLVERYALAVTPGLSLVDPRPLQRGDLPVLLAGVSQPVQGFTALPGVRAELEALRSLLGGETMLDEAFTQEAFGAALQEGEPGLVHIASHAHFGGRAADNFVLTHDRRMSLDSLADYIGSARFRENPLELLVLSACQTAVGNDKAALGLAGVAVRAGARSSIGSLWSISDEATAVLMRRFYGALRQPGTSRAQALRQAQRSLLDEERFRHPLFWSPFLLINNWL